MSRRPSAAPQAGAVSPGRELVTSPFAPRYRSVTIGMVALVALSAFEALAVTTAMPLVVDALGGLGLYAMAFAGPMASGLAGMVVGGSWSDRSGPVRPLVTGVALFVLGLLVAGAALGMPVVVAGRVVQGLGSGMLNVALYVLVARLFPDAVQPRLFAAFAAAWVLPAVVGPAIAGTIAETVGWRWVFLAVPLLAVPALLLMRPALRGTPSPSSDVAGGRGSGRSVADDVVRDDAARDSRVPDGTVPGSRVPDGTVPDDVVPGGGRDVAADRARLLRAIGAGIGLLVLQLGGQSSGARAGLLAGVGVVLLVVTVPRLLPTGTLQAARGIPAVIGLRGLVASAFFGAEVYLPLLLTTERGLSASRAGLVLTVGAVTWSTGSWLRGRSEGRWSDRAVLRAGAGGIGVGVALAALSVWPTIPVAVGIAGWGVAGLAMGMAYPTLSLLTLRLSSPSEQGVNSSALQMNESLANALVLALSGPVFAALVATRPTQAFLACFAVSIALSAVGVVVAGRVPRTTTAARGAS
jgi:MFS family permease